MKATANPASEGRGKILLVASATNTLELQGGRVVPTGYYLDELAVPARLLIDAGYEVVVATPDGNAPPMDASSDDVSHFGNDPEKLRQALHFALTHPTVQKPESLCDAVAAGLDRFAGIFAPGGHAPMNDLMQDPALGQALRYFHQASKPTAFLCHGPIALLAALPLASEYRRALVGGDLKAAQAAGAGWPYAGYRMTIFSNEEELLAEKSLQGKVPFYVADALKGAGGLVENGPAFQSFVVRDRELITGQNPASDRAIAEAFLTALDEARKKGGKQP
jgi:putative intracellular protease/amidase